MIALILGCASYERPPDLHITDYRGHRPAEFCRYIDNRMIWQFDGPIDRVVLEAALARHGGHIATCDGRAGCNERTIFLIQLPETRWSCWEFRAAQEPEIDGHIKAAHFAPGVDSCTCELDWWERPTKQRTSALGMEALNAVQGAPPDWDGPPKGTPSQSDPDWGLSRREREALREARETAP